MTSRLPKDCIKRAYEKFIENDSELLSVNANERSLTHKLAEYLQVEYPDWNVDCEYNRDSKQSKRLDSTIKAIKSDNLEGVTVYPDIIVHHRNTFDNFIVIEAKKSNNPNQDEDEDKLKAYKRELGYQHAFTVMFLVDVKYQDIDLSELINEVIL